MSDNFVITIDGPAGAGKTTIARMVAERIGFRYVDTGAMYRAVTLKVIDAKIPFSNVGDIEKLADKTEISIDFNNASMVIYLDGREVTKQIRCSAVTDNTSRVAAMAGVRNKLADLQRKAARKFKKTVFEGRDTGSVVFPDADIKVYLDAGIRERAKRRWLELKDRGIEVDLTELEKKIKKRDKLDESRGLAPLRIPENSRIIDSTNMSIEEVVEEIIGLLDR